MPITVNTFKLRTQDAIFWNGVLSACLQGADAIWPTTMPSWAHWLLALWFVASAILLAGAVDIVIELYCGSPPTDNGQSSEPASP